jgi:hypothetical protein
MIIKVLSILNVATYINISLVMILGSLRFLSVFNVQGNYL